MKKETRYGIEYILPQVVLLNEPSVGIAELASRTAYDSFDNSENVFIRDMSHLLNDGTESDTFAVTKKYVNELKDSKLVDQLVNVFHHDSIGEHIIFQFSIKGIGRGVLQEFARHRVGVSLTVRSTRYTMDTLIACFHASQPEEYSREEFIRLMYGYNRDIFIFDERRMFESEAGSIYDKLKIAEGVIGCKQMFENTLSKSAIAAVDELCDSGVDCDAETAFNTIMAQNRKRNAGDSIKFVVSDNWSTDLIVTMNQRSLKHFIKLRDSGAAWFQIKWLAEEMFAQVPKELRKLIKKEK